MAPETAAMEYVVIVKGEHNCGGPNMAPGVTCPTVIVLDEGRLVPQALTATTDKFPAVEPFVVILMLTDPCPELIVQPEGTVQV